MGALYKNGKPVLITPRNGKNWCDTVNQPIPDHVKKHHQDQFAATHSSKVVLKGRWRYDTQTRTLVPAGETP